MARVMAEEHAQRGLGARRPWPEEERGARVFISYSRKDAEKAERLRNALVASGFEAYLDKHDILPGEPWQERLTGLIEAADSVVFLPTPASVRSAGVRLGGERGGAPRQKGAAGGRRRHRARYRSRPAAAA